MTLFIGPKEKLRRIPPPAWNNERRDEILILPFEKPLHLEEAQLSTGVLLSRLIFCSVKDKKLMHKKFFSTHTVFGKRTLRV